MCLANLVRLNVYTTDVDLLFQRYGVLASRLGAAEVAPTTTMLEVTRLAGRQALTPRTRCRVHPPLRHRDPR